MKKTALTILLTMAASVLMHAQSAYDAWLFSENNYEGTARSVAMGNAFTALGGDLGAVTINPAGSAVAPYSQLTITPSLTFSANTSVGVPYEGSSDPYFQRTFKSRMTRAGIPNVGFTFNFDTGRKSGLKRITAGFVMNRTNSWCEDIYANGINSNTSFLAATAAEMHGQGITTDMLLDADAYRNPDLYWKDIVAYRSGMVSGITSHPDAYIGATETLTSEDPLEMAQEGQVDQTYGRSITGSKYEYLFNAGANISDFLYIGINLGINSLSYDYARYFKEKAVDPEDFKNSFTGQDGLVHDTFFSRAIYRYEYSTTGSGVFGKLGIIVTPAKGLRFGAAIQTPTSNEIKEKRQESAVTEFTDNSFNGEENSPVAEFQYKFNSPFRANFGVAYTFGKMAILSVDYEVADYGSMRFKYDRHEMAEGDIEYFEGLNKEIENSYGTAHYLRVGAEVRPVSTIAVRAGYNLSTSAQTATYDGTEFIPLDRTYGHNISFGLGYNSKKSFFADIACRYTFATDEYILPYSDYRINDGFYSPEILSSHSDWKVLLTLGWRF